MRVPKKAKIFSTTSVISLNRIGKWDEHTYWTVGQKLEKLGYERVPEKKGGTYWRKKP